MTAAISRRYVKDTFGVLAPADRSKFAYSDGDAEELYLFELMKELTDRNSLADNFKVLAVSWASYYHLSPVRANLLRAVREQLQGKLVLELGAGCGALTRYLGETARRVVAVEGSPARARITAMRCDDLNNVIVVNDTIQNFTPGQQFDVVTLIGVLEYARLYGTEPCPELALLETVRRFLKPGGLLLLAIENRLGLKYFAGALEDHLNMPFAGINGSYGEKTAVTFGRKELEALLSKAGFTATELFIPLPDYKFPVSVLHPSALDSQEPGIDLVPFAVQSVNGDIQLPTPTTFSLEAAYQSIIKNGLLPDLCNSFFFIASNGGQETGLDPRVLVSHYGGYRLPAFAKECRFIRHEDKVRVTRNLLDAERSGSSLGIRVTFPETEDYLPFANYALPLIEVLNRPGWSSKDIADWAAPWVSLLAANAVANAGGDLFLPPEGLDMIPKNMLIRPDAALHPFDLEWRVCSDEKIPLSVVLIRGLFTTLDDLSNVAPPADEEDLAVAPLIMRVLAHNGIIITQGKMREALAYIAAFAERSMGGKPSLARLQGLKLTKRRAH